MTGDRESSPYNLKSEIFFCTAPQTQYTGLARPFYVRYVRYVRYTQYASSTRSFGVLLDKVLSVNR